MRCQEELGSSSHAVRSNRLAAEPWTHLSSHVCAQLLQLSFTQILVWRGRCSINFQESHSALKGTWGSRKLRKTQNILKAKFLSVSALLASYLNFTVLPGASFSYIVRACSKFTLPAAG